MILEERLNLYHIFLYYDGEQAAGKKIDLTKKYRFNYGDPSSQLQEANNTSCKERNDPRIKDLELPCQTFPPYQGNNQKTQEYLEQSDYGVVLSSRNGCLTAKRLCQSKIYRGTYRLGKFKKLKRRAETEIFSLKDYADKVQLQAIEPYEAICLTYGKKPTPVGSNICLLIKPVLMQSIHSFLKCQPSIESSCTESFEDSLDTEVRLNNVFKEIQPLIDGTL